MKITKALKKRKKGQTISSEKANMQQQKPKDFIYWLLTNDDDIKYKMSTLESIINANDWSIDEDSPKAF